MNIYLISGVPKPLLFLVVFSWLYVLPLTPAVMSKKYTKNKQANNKKYRIKNLIKDSSSDNSKST